VVVCGAHHHRVARHADGGCQLGRVFRRGRVDGSGDGEDVAQHEEGAHTGTDQGIAQSGLDGAAAQVCAQQHACQRNGERVDEEADGAEGKGRGGEVVIGEEVFVVEQRAGEQRVEQRGEGERGCATGEREERGAGVDERMEEAHLEEQSPIAARSESRQTSRLLFRRAVRALAGRHRLAAIRHGLAGRVGCCATGCCAPTRFAPWDEKTRQRGSASCNPQSHRSYARFFFRKPTTRSQARSAASGLNGGTPIAAVRSCQDLYGSGVSFMKA